MARVCSDKREAVRHRKSSFLRHHLRGAIDSAAHHNAHSRAGPGTSASLDEVAQTRARQGGTERYLRSPTTVRGRPAVAAARRRALGARSCHVSSVGHMTLV